MIHVPLLPLLYGSRNYASIQWNLVVRGTLEFDFTCPKYVSTMSAHNGALGKVWDDCVHPSSCLFEGYGLNEYRKSRVQWVSGIAQYIFKL